jgi:hypothetical protein
VPQDGVEVMLRAERVHNVVYYIIAAYAAGQPVNSDVSLALKIGGCMPQLLPHKGACNASLVVLEERSEAWMRVLDAGDEASIVEGQVLDRLKNQLGWNTG